MKSQKAIRGKMLTAIIIIFTIIVIAFSSISGISRELSGQSEILIGLVNEFQLKL